ncbi:hypothetical protein K443DRAFT_676680 [Laccaria amethystina LaAM-08-1]|uniref:Chromatin associated protein KTI12 n=1 Tax=Laccaria amethystina LaAM-08-1 TaxID=1095629 RepID=A0A0C9XF80_9AGAR|nr:hypothetical protein K443DRAFT_676680 [Laccaria amethystina LaAM-08-1]
MALITISGYPSSGKTTRANQIFNFLQIKLQNPEYQGPNLKVVLLSDDSLDIPRAAYDDSKLEKAARGALFTAIQRLIARDTLLIVDSLNYIKGFRYQVYCAAREMKLRVCTVYVVATPDLCREWNSKRGDGHDYDPDTIDNLIMRYEEPSSMVRWDSPLLTVMWEDADIPGPQIWEAVTLGSIKPPNSGTLSAAKAPTDALHVLEQITASMVSAILAERSASQLETLVSLTLPGSIKLQLTLPSRHITLSELQRFKRQFITVHKKAITLGTTEKGAVDWEENNIAHKFATYLEDHLRA